MGQRISKARVLKEIGCPKLDLVRDPAGYCYFIYDDVDANIYETHSVMVMWLNRLSEERWIEEGRSFVARVEAKKEGR